MKTLLIALSIALLSLPVSATTLQGGADDDNCDWWAYEKGRPEPQGQAWGWVCIYDHWGKFKQKDWYPPTVRQSFLAHSRGVDTTPPPNPHPRTWAEIQATGGLTPLRYQRVPSKDVAETARTGILPSR